MIILDVEQGTPEWDDARCGIPSASIFDKILTTKGALSKSAIKLIYKLAGERITGKKEDGYCSPKMAQAMELEGEARYLFQMITGLKVSEVGVCYYDERKDRSCSPDGLVETGQTLMEGLEIKCPEMSAHVEYLLGKKLPTTYFQQVQGSLYVTGLERWHFFSYYPSMKPFHIVVERDEIWIAKLGKALDDFVIELDETHKLLTGD